MSALSEPHTPRHMLLSIPYPAPGVFENARYEQDKMSLDDLDLYFVDDSQHEEYAPDIPPQHAHAHTRTHLCT